MTVDSISYPYRDADHLASAEKSFYPLRIPVSHYQLRHYISTPEPNLIYYASSHDIYCLNTVTKKRRHITTLPFDARCTASGYGWVCVGGEVLGEFAAIKLDGSGPRTMDVDSALPIDNWRQEGGRRAASVKVERMGEDIVNSISVHRIQDEEAHLDDIVAVLTNNDKTVRMYSLPQNLETQVLDLPFAMNHASVSPDGRMLVAVGDINQAYFFQRDISETPPQIPKPHNRLTSASLDWSLTAIVTLHVSDPGLTEERVPTQGYFTTAWSPSGDLVAVGSEGGYITVFDIARLCDPDVPDKDAVVAVVPGTRRDSPYPHPGAIRSMIFSPEPWDLLIWAEDQDRVCIGDLRRGMKTRQVIKLDPKEEGLQEIEIEDVPGEEVITLSAPSRDIDEVEAEFLRRYRSIPNDATAVNFATEYIEARRRQRQQRQDSVTSRRQDGLNFLRTAPPSDDDPQGLTPREQQILESLRTTRQREEARAAAGGLPRSINYTTSEALRSTNRTTGESSSSARPISEILNSVQESLPELARTSAGSARPGSSHGAENMSGLPSLSQLQAGWMRLNDGSRLPRRRASVILSPPATNSSSTPSTTNANRATDETTQRQPTEEEEDNPWQTIEEHMSLARGPLFERAVAAASEILAETTSTASQPTDPAELQAEISAERRRRSLVGQREDSRLTTAEQRALAAHQARVSAAAANTTYPSPLASGSRLPTFTQGGEILLRRAQLPRYTSSQIGVRTAGLAMSPDGRLLWVACEDGIFEIKINVKGRLFWGAVEPR